MVIAGGKNAAGGWIDRKCPYTPLQQVKKYDRSTSTYYNMASV